MFGLLPPALVCPLTGPAVWRVIYVYDHVVGPGCHGQQDGNPLINTLSGAFTLPPCFIETKMIKQYDCLFRGSFISSNSNIISSHNYYAALIIKIIFSANERIILVVSLVIKFRKSNVCVCLIEYLVYTESNSVNHLLKYWSWHKYPLQSQVLSMLSQIPARSAPSIQFPWFISSIPAEYQLLIPNSDYTV